MDDFFWNLQEIQFRSCCFSKLQFLEVFWFAAVVSCRNIIVRIKSCANIESGFRHAGLCSFGVVVLLLSRFSSFAVACFVSPRDVLVLKLRLRPLALTLLISSCWSRRLGLAVLVSSSPLTKFCACSSQNRVRIMFKIFRKLHWHGAKHALWSLFDLTT